MHTGTIRKINIDEEMRGAYLDYAMSVIVSRALPDVRDGLKPVHRRILYAMYDMGLRPNQSYKKSARIVGEVLGKYHPHGDSAVYDAMVRLAQDFSMRYPLVDGQGNFGSIDGDNAAAMRYTEARLAPIAMEMLADIDKETVDFVDNFDGTLQEPAVLPARLPNLLVNGASGIAVGMTTNIPPHNLGEICDALCYLIDHYDQRDDITAQDLMRFVQGPDFPTGGIIYRYRSDRNHDNTDTILNAYATGRGQIVVQARTHVEEMSRGRHRIVVTELPYQVNRANLVERIAQLVRDGKLDNISDLRDESDRSGMRIVIELTRNADPTETLETLFKQTPMRQTFGVIMLALVDGQPRMLTLKSALLHYIEHRIQVVRRRSAYELDRARHRTHVLEGLRIALDTLDAIIETIRRSRTQETARTNLRKRFKLTETQAEAILSMQLRRLAALERRKIEEEYKVLRKRIAELERLLATPALVLHAIRDELVELKRTYGDPRRTVIVTETDYTGAVSTDALIADAPVVVTVGQKEEVERIVNLADAPRQATHLRFVRTMQNRHECFVISRDGMAWRRSVHLVPQRTNTQTTTSLAQWLNAYERRHTFAALVDFPTDWLSDEQSPASLVLVSTQGRVMRIAASSFGAMIDAVNAFSLSQNDAVLWAGIAPTEDDEIVLLTRQGQAIRFALTEVRPMGPGASGVMGIKLQGKDDAVVGAGLRSEGTHLLVMTTQGYAKRTPLDEFPIQGRYGKGVIATKLSPRVGTVVGGGVVRTTDKLILHTQRKSILLPVARVEEASRTARGSQPFKRAAQDSVQTLAIWKTTPLATPTTGPVPEPAKPARSRKRPPSRQKKTSSASKTNGAKKSKRKRTTSTTRKKRRSTTSVDKKP
nr:DNA gyrase subunit A [Ardenticatena sp.]